MLLLRVMGWVNDGIVHDLAPFGYYPFVRTQWRCVRVEFSSKQMKKFTAFGVIAAASLCLSQPAYSELDLAEVPKETVKNRIKDAELNIAHFFSQFRQRADRTMRCSSRPKKT